MRAREAQLKNFFQNVEAALRGVGDRTHAVSRWEVRAPHWRQQSARARMYLCIEVHSYDLHGSHAS